MISFHTFTHQENVLVKLHFGEHTGMGEAAPFEWVTGDSQQDVLDQLTQLNEIPLDPRDTEIPEFHRFLDDYAVSATTRAALDFAYHDLIGKIRGVPVWKLYASRQHRASESFTLSIKAPNAMGEETRSVCEKYPELEVLKIKLKGDEADIERAERIRAALPRPMRFMIDANQGFENPEEAVRILRKIQGILGDVILVEEPLPKGDLDGLKQVKDQIEGTMIFADESVVNLEDAMKIIKKQAADGINIKLQKAGGIWPGRRIVEAAESAGLKVMTGCMLEGPLAITAGVHFTASTPNVIVTDLSADLLTTPHTRSAATLENGQRIPPPHPGLGVEYDKARIKELTKSGELVIE